MEVRWDRSSAIDGGLGIDRCWVIDLVLNGVVSLDNLLHLGGIQQC